MILGVDIGGVIISRANDNTDTSFFSKNYLHTTAEEKAFSSLRILNQRFHEVHLVSKCGFRTQRKTLEWLEHNMFHQATGIPATRVHFCIERAHKAPICAKYGITHFIDDRLEILSYLTTVPHKYLFKGSAGEIANFAATVPHVTRVESWSDVLTRVGI